MSDSEKTIERIGAARDFATKEANRFLIVSVVLGFVYLAKTDGIGLDEIVFGKKLSDIHVAAFVYLAASQFSAALAQIRYADASIFDRRLSELLGTAYGLKGSLASMYPNQRDWFSPTLSVVSNNARGTHRFLFWLAAAPSLLLTIAVFTLPTACGFLYLGNPLNLKFSTTPDADVTLIAISTFINLIWLIQAVSLVSFLEGSGGQEHANSVSGSRS